MSSSEKRMLKRDLDPRIRYKESRKSQVNAHREVVKIKLESGKRMTFHIFGYLVARERCRFSEVRAKLFKVGGR